MNYIFPNKYSNPICGECHSKEEKKYHECRTPCSDLISWAATEAHNTVVKAARDTVFDEPHPLEDEC